MWKKVILVFSVLCMLIVMVSCGGNSVTPPIDDSSLAEYSEIIDNNKIAIKEFIEYSSIYSDTIARQKTVEWLNKQSNIEEAGLSEDGTVWFEYKNGVMVGFLPGDEEENKNIIEESFKPDLYTPLKTTNATKSTPLNEKAIVLAPFPVLNLGKAEAIRDKILFIDGFSCDEVKSSSEVTIKVMKELYKYGIVYIVSHGTILDDNVCIALNLIITDELHSKYKSDFDSRRLVYLYKNIIQELIDYFDIANKGYVGITPSFITNHAIKSYPNSLIYFNGCYSLKKPTMAKAFTKAGAHTYCGYSSKTFAPLTCDETAFDNMIFKGMSVKDACDNTDCSFSYVDYLGLDTYSDNQDELYLKPLNHPPVISSLTANPSSININQTTTITCTATDEDFGDSAFFEYTWSNNGGSFEGDNSGSSVTWKAPSTQGNYTITCEVSDGEASDSKQVVITVNDPGSTNHPPDITSSPVTSATKDESYSYDVNATDPDVGDTLTYSLTTNPTGMNINSSTGVITWTPTSTGDYNVTVKVSDGELFETQSFVITVSDPPPDSPFKIFLQSGGSLNGNSINPSNPVLTVNTGESITGILNVQATYSGTPGNIVPFGYTPSWGSHSSSYVTAKSDLPVGTTTYNVSIDLNAPATSGTYFLIFATNAEMNLGWTMSRTNWTTGSMSWNDGKDIADLTESNLDDSLSTGYLYLDMLEGSTYKTTTYGIAYVKIIVTEGSSTVSSGSVHNLSKNTYYDTIQAALDDADNNNTIEVSDGIYDEKIVFPPYKKVILQSVNGAFLTTIRGDDDYATVNAYKTLEGTTIEGFTITHADGLTGAGINLNKGNLSINNCIISGNTAGYHGGGIFIPSNSGTMSIGGDSADEKNTLCGNSKSGYNPSLDQQIGTAAISGSLYETYKDTNYISAYCE